MDEITQLLPQESTFSLRDRNHFGWSDLYGSVNLAASYCGRKYRQDLLDFFWNHGCLPPWQNLHPGAITYGFNEKKAKYFVAREDQKKYLKSHGFENVHSIGMPIIYVPNENIPRKPNSLLIMPPHILKSSIAPSLLFEQDYVKSIENYFDSFDTIYACINPICIEKGMWLDTFKKYNIKVLSGASHNDSNTLIRMANMFRYFDVVTTPTFGSHIPYALYFGAKVSIWGNYQTESKVNILRDGTWRKIPEIAEKFFNTEWRNRQERAYFEKHYVSPTDAIGDQKLGAWFLGAEFKRSPEELRELFGWTAFDMARKSARRIYIHFRTSKIGTKAVSLISGK